MRTSRLDNPERKAVIRLGPSPRGERASARSCFLAPFLPKFGLKSGRGTYFLDGNAWRGRLGFGSLASASVAEVLPCSSSSLPHQQHGEFRRVKENNRGNGAREVGFKPPPLLHINNSTGKTLERDGNGRKLVPGPGSHATGWNPRCTWVLNICLALLRCFVFQGLGLRGRLETVPAMRLDAQE